MRLVRRVVCSIASALSRTIADLALDPTMHGEITAIRHCTDVLRKRGLSVQETLAAWKEFSLYTNGEPCPMCASAIRWAGFKEVIYGSSIRTIAESESIRISKIGGFIS